MIYPVSFSTDAAHSRCCIRPPPTKLVFMAFKTKTIPKGGNLMYKKNDNISFLTNLKNHVLTTMMVVSCLFSLDILFGYWIKKEKPLMVQVSTMDYEKLGRDFWTLEEQKLDKKLQKVRTKIDDCQRYKLKLLTNFTPSYITRICSRRTKTVRMDKVYAAQIPSQSIDQDDYRNGEYADHIERQYIQTLFFLTYELGGYHFYLPCDPSEYPDLEIVTADALEEHKGSYRDVLPICYSKKTIYYIKQHGLPELQAPEQEHD